MSRRSIVVVSIELLSLSLLLVTLLVVCHGDDASQTLAQNLDYLNYIDDLTAYDDNQDDDNDGQFFWDEYDDDANYNQDDEELRLRRKRIRVRKPRIPVPVPRLPIPRVPIPVPRIPLPPVPLIPNPVKPAKKKNPLAIPLPSVPTFNFNELGSDWQSYFTWLDQKSSLLKQLKNQYKAKYVQDIGAYAAASLSHMEEVCNVLFVRMVDEFKEAWDGTVNEFNNGLNKAKNAGAMIGEVSKAYAQGRLGVASAISDWTSSAWDKVRGGLDDAWKKFKSLGGLLDDQDERYQFIDYWNLHDNTEYLEKYAHRRRMAVCDIPDPLSVYNEIKANAKPTLTNIVNSLTSQSFYNQFATNLADNFDDDQGEVDRAEDEDALLPSNYRVKNGKCHLKYGMGMKFSFCGSVTVFFAYDFAACIGVVWSTRRISQSTGITGDNTGQNLESGIWEWSWSYQTEILAVGGAVSFSLAATPDSFYGRGWAANIGGSMLFAELGASVGIFGTASMGYQPFNPILRDNLQVTGGSVSFGAGVGISPVNLQWTNYARGYLVGCQRLSACDCSKKICYKAYPVELSSSRCASPSATDDSDEEEYKYR